MRSHIARPATPLQSTPAATRPSWTTYPKYHSTQHTSTLGRYLRFPNCREKRKETKRGPACRSTAAVIRTNIRFHRTKKNDSRKSKSKESEKSGVRFCFPPQNQKYTPLLAPPFLLFHDFVFSGAAAAAAARISRDPGFRWYISMASSNGPRLITLFGSRSSAVSAVCVVLLPGDGMGGSYARTPLYFTSSGLVFVAAPSPLVPALRVSWIYVWRVRSCPAGSALGGCGITGIGC
ncbi:hypothetical protein V8C26DRAFT_383836 [Trichoderma gracile]